MLNSSMPPEDAVLDAIDAGLMILNQDQRVVGWNAWMSSATNISSEQAAGKLLSEVFPGANLNRVSMSVNSALKTGVSSLITHALHAQIFPLKTRAGRDLLHDVTVSALGNHTENRCLIHIADVTMSVRRERYLRDRQNARYDAVVSNAPDVILTIDSDGAIRLINDVAVTQFGLAREELIGKPAVEMFSDQALWQRTWEQVLAEGKLSNPVELVAPHRDGSANYFEVSASRWQSDSRTFVTAILRDINERRATANALALLNATLEQRVEERTAQLQEVEEALRQSQKMEAIGQLTGGIAHDFNNLLQGIIGALNLVEKRISEGRIGEVDRFLRGAISSAERAANLTHRLLAFSRKQPIDPRPVDVSQLVGSIEELLRRSLGEGIKMSFSMEPDLWLVRCDANQLENAFLNLAINARDAMPLGGTLEIGGSNITLDAGQAALRDIPPGEYLRLAIRDSGSGMPPEVQSRAFDPFYTTKPLGRGTGLGLSTIYGFIRQSAGSVRIESEVGQGTLIEICIPRFSGELEPILPGVLDPSDNRAANREIVLVVEDEDIVRLLVVEVLNDLNYHVLEAIDGPSALRILNSSQRLDLMVTDIGLPDINGRQVAETAREKRPNLKILFMTGYAEGAAGDEFLEEGMEIITKPFTMDKLANKIRDMVERP
jgi:PAS domain S-box-containing protein